MFNKVKSFAPLSLSFSMLILFFFIVLFFVVSRMQSLSFISSKMYEYPIIVSNTVMEIENNIIKIHRTMKDIALAKTKFEIEEASAMVERYEKEVFNDFIIISERFLGDEKMYNEALAKFRAWKPIRDEVISLLYQGKKDEAAEITKGKGAQHVIQLEETMMALHSFAQNKAGIFQKDVIEIRNKTLKTMFVVVLILLFAGAFFIIVLIRTESRMHWSVEALEKSEEKFHKFFDNAPVYCYMVSPEGMILDINSAALNTLGYEKKEVVGKPLMTSIYAPSSIEKVKNLLTKWKKIGILRDEELNIISKNGEERTVLLSADAIKDADGKLLHSISVQRDITLRKQAEEILKEHGEQLEKLVDQRTKALQKSENSLTEAQRIAHLGNWDWDIVNNELQWSDEIYRIFGLTPQQFGATYEAFLDSVHPDDREFVNDSVNKALNEHKPYSIDHRIVLPDSSERVVHEQAKVFLDETDRAVRMVGTVLDITERKRAEEEKTELEEQLRRSKQMEMLGHVTSGVAHEVRNPLNSITAISEALFKEIGENPEYQPYLEHIRNQVNRLSTLMKDLLDYGRPIQLTDMQPANIEKIVEDVVDDCKQVSSCNTCNISLVKPIEAQVWQVKVDTTKIQQVFINLIENACNHNPECCKLTIMLSKEDEEVVIKVKDNGTGIPAEMIMKVFEPFFTTRKKGTGLGLSIVKNIVEFHGGTVILYNNEPLPGITVELKLPLYESEKTEIAFTTKAGSQ